MPMSAQTVESFSLCLERYNELLHTDEPVRFVEDRLLEQLEAPVRLLRWAIVKVEGAGEHSKFWCEGAYLKTCQ
jgi:hypothetical protein